VIRPLGRGLENGIWGIVPELEHLWRKIGENDIVLFTVKLHSQFFGAGILRSKFKQTYLFGKKKSRKAELFGLIDLSLT
jgi:hypothetical protein